MDKRYKVLLVDNEQSNITLLCEILQDTYDLLTTTDGGRAIELARSNAPDLILLDIVMPVMDGYEVCRLIKEDHLLREVPVIFLTALNQAENECRGLELGAVDYISKPFRSEIVKLRIKNQIELKVNRDKLFYLSNLDKLTEMPNRRAIDTTLEKEIFRAIRINRHISMLMIDIDFFKQYNDNYGHISGDNCLKSIADAIRSSLRRPEDFAGRYGGEEFLCILPNINEEGALVVSERILNSVKDLSIPHHFSQVSDIVSVSIGALSLIPNMELPISRIVQMADEALYRAKNKGRNRVST